jgi:hypothetical protein
MDRLLAIVSHPSRFHAFLSQIVHVLVVDTDPVSSMWKQVVSLFADAGERIRARIRLTCLWLVAGTPLQWWPCEREGSGVPFDFWFE